MSPFTLRRPYPLPIIPEVITSLIYLFHSEAISPYRSLSLLCLSLSPSLDLSINKSILDPGLCAYPSLFPADLSVSPTPTVSSPFLSTSLFSVSFLHQSLFTLSASLPPSLPLSLSVFLSLSLSL